MAGAAWTWLRPQPAAASDRSSIAAEARRSYRKLEIFFTLIFMAILIWVKGLFRTKLTIAAQSANRGQNCGAAAVPDFVS
jgi:hypothetical protein